MTDEDFVRKVGLVLRANERYYSSFKFEVTYVVDHLADLAVDVGFGTWLRCRG